MNIIIGTHWEHFTDWLRWFKGKFITRQQLIEDMRMGYMSGYRFSISTIDQYKQILIDAGYILQCCRGQYKIKENFPDSENCSFDQVRLQALKNKLGG